MNRLLYANLIRAAAPLVAARVYMRGRSDPLYRASIGERFGHYPETPHDRNRPVWIHAVSLGETRAAQPLVQSLLNQGLPVLLTHMTATGRREGQRLFADAAARGQLTQCWVPYDFPNACRRFLAAMRPRCGILIEREVWPNLVHAANEQGVPMALVSARLSERSARRGQYAGRVLRDAFAGLAQVQAQTEEDARRLRQAGARQVQVAGNIKFDAAVSEHQITRGLAWRSAWDRPVIVVASTHEGEEAAFAQALLARCGQATAAQPLLVIVPRHPERFDPVAAQLGAAGLRVARRSGLNPLQPLPPDTQVLLGDSMGEMASYYAASDVAIVAGGFLSTGGQNLIEACATGTPVVVGPHARHFKQATTEAIAAGAAIRTPDAEAALAQALALLDAPAQREQMGQAGRAYVARHAGAVQRIVQALELLLAMPDTAAPAQPGPSGAHTPPVNLQMQNH